MIRLLSNQTLRIDSHQPGEFRWNDSSQDIHLHKKSNNNSKCKYDIRIPLNSTRKASVLVDGSHDLTSVPNKIRTEVNSVINGDANKRDDFIRQLRDALETIGCTDADMANVAEKIERAFGIEHGVLSNQFAKERCYMKLSEQNHIHYQTIVNHHLNQIYIGQFSLGNMTGIHLDSRRLWESALIGHLDEIFNCESKPELEQKLEVLAKDIKGINKRTKENALEAICRLYDIPD